jgi:hypothetical protein
MGFNSAFKGLNCEGVDVTRHAHVWVQYHSSVNAVLLS